MATRIHSEAGMRQSGRAPERQLGARVFQITHKRLGNPTFRRVRPVPNCFRRLPLKLKSSVTPLPPVDIHSLKIVAAGEGPG